MPAASEFGAAFSFFLNNYYLFRTLQSQIYIINYLQDYLILCHYNYFNWEVLVPNSWHEIGFIL